MSKLDFLKKWIEIEVFHLSIYLLHSLDIIDLSRMLNAFHIWIY